jgi:hypothetical protein
MSKDYEKLYIDLKKEHEQSVLDNDEICKEYESTIKMLTDSIESFKTEKTNLENKLSLLEKEQKKFEKEKESLLSKNKDKICDIQNLNKQIDKLKTELKKIKEDKNIVKDKIIALETDNDHYQNKLRQDEALIEDLNSQLESALEENITLQTEFELYKQHNEEALIRKDQEIKDFQNDIVNKEKIIQRLNDKRANNIKELKQKLLMPQEILKQYQRKLTNTMYKEDKEKIKLNEGLKNDKISSTIIFDKVVTPLTETNPQYPPKFMEIYRKSIREDELDNIDNQSDKNKFNNNITATNQDTIKNSQSLLKDANVNDSFLLKKHSSDNIMNDNNNPLLKTKTLKEDSIVNGDLEGMDMDEKNNKEENEEEDSTASDKKCFEDLVICDEKDFHIIPIKKLMNENKKNRDKKLADNLRNMLVRIQKRRDVLIKNQKNNNLKLAKLGYKLDIKL